MLRSIILEGGDFIKELTNIVHSNEKDNDDIKLIAWKTIGNLSIDVFKNLAKDEKLLKKLVELTQS